MSSSKTLSIGIGLIGPGLIGKELLRQIHSQADRLRTANGIDLHLAGIANSRKMVASSRAGAIDLANWQEALQASETAVDLGEFAVKVKESGVSASVIIDCTASDAVPEFYPRWMLMGVHIVTPNKKLHSGPLPQYTAVKAMQRAGTAHYFYETTCGAGLPVLSTLKGLVETGDRVLKVEGILSGTLSFLFNSVKPGVAFSSVVADARSRGFTEPDPREDLSGSDVARKVAILARESGADVELTHIAVESLVPAALASTSSVDEFMEKLPQYDAEMAARIEAADAAGCVLRYVGVYDAEGGGSCSVALQRYPKDHAFAQLSGTDNIVSFTTARYRDQPLVVRGPGAGPAVTAAGVFADLLMLARFLGASA